MITAIIRKALNVFHYDIARTKYYNSRKYKKRSDQTNLNYYETPTGNYYLPAWLKGDVVANKIKEGAYYDIEVIEIARKYIKEGTAVLDVGANYGQMSIHFSELAGKGTVYSFEAEPIIFEILKKNIQANGCTNIKPILGAVYDRAGKKLVYPEPDFKKVTTYGSYGIAPNASEGRTVESLTIDSLDIREPISFMKVDIQGSDLFAMQGARETIMRHRMPILFEFEQPLQQYFGTSFNDYIQFVDSVNYKFKAVHGSNYLVLPKD